MRIPETGPARFFRSPRTIGSGEGALITTRSTPRSSTTAMRRAVRFAGFSSALDAPAKTENTDAAARSTTQSRSARTCRSSLTTRSMATSAGEMSRLSSCQIAPGVAPPPGGLAAARRMRHHLQFFCNQNVLARVGSPLYPGASTPRRHISMNRLLHRCLVSSFVLCAAFAARAATTSFTATYTGQGSGASTCGTTFSISGQEPSTTGTHPVFVYMVGTSETYTNASATAAVTGMANRGYVAATVQYDSGSFGNCAQISGKAQCIFDASSATSAVRVLCARAKADCSKGIVVGGFSQGSVIA